MPNPNPLCVVILTFNSENSLASVVKSCLPLKPRIVVVDSFSKDNTVAVAESLGCEVLQHPFENYAKQRNWAQGAINAPGGWYLHLDSDEVLSPKLCASIGEVVSADQHSHEGYIMRRVPFFMGRQIRFGAKNASWHLRLYKVGAGRCEDRKYDQHYVMDSPAGVIRGNLLDLQLVTLEQWTASHNRWSTAEAEEIANSQPDKDDSGDQLPASLFGDSRMRKRWMKNKIWPHIPLLVRPFLFFFYSYFLRLGFLDGRVGLIYHLLTALWFRFLVDAKVLEQRYAANDIKKLVERVDRESDGALVGV